MKVLVLSLLTTLATGFTFKASASETLQLKCSSPFQGNSPIWVSVSFLVSLEQFENGIPKLLHHTPLDENGQTGTTMSFNYQGLETVVGDAFLTYGNDKVRSALKLAYASSLKSGGALAVVMNDEFYDCERR